MFCGTCHKFGNIFFPSAAGRSCVERFQCNTHISEESSGAASGCD